MSFRLRIMQGTAKQVGQSAKTLAQQMARQMVREPLEILKDAREQVAGVETPKPQEAQTPSQTPEDQTKILNNQRELQDKTKSTRRMEALNRELEDIHKQDVFKDLQERIANGEQVPLENYAELTMEQRQVLNAQKEAVKFREQQAAYNQSREGVKIPGSKKGRKFGSSQKQEAEKQQTRVEKPVPPSG